MNSFQLVMNSFSDRYSHTVDCVRMIPILNVSIVASMWLFGDHHRDLHDLSVTKSENLLPYWQKQLVKNNYFDELFVTDVRGESCRQKLRDQWKIMLMNFLLFQSRTDGYFTFREVDRRHVAIVLAKSLEHLTDQSRPTPFIR